MCALPLELRLVLVELRLQPGHFVLVAVPPGTLDLLLEASYGRSPGGLLHFSGRSDGWPR